MKVLDAALATIASAGIRAVHRDEALVFSDEPPYKIADAIPKLWGTCGRYELLQEIDTDEIVALLGLKTFDDTTGECTDPEEATLWTALEDYYWLRDYDDSPGTTSRVMLFTPERKWTDDNTWVSVSETELEKARREINRLRMVVGFAAGMASASTFEEFQSFRQQYHRANNN